MKRIVYVVMVAALAGCGSNRLSAELKPYLGRDIHELSARLGEPNGRRETTGDRVYVWSADSDTVLPSTPSASNAGNSGGMTYAGSSTPSGLMPVQLECTLEVTVDAKNLVQHYQFEGSNAGCANFRRMLSR